MKASLNLCHTLQHVVLYFDNIIDLWNVRNACKNARGIINGQLTQKLMKLLIQKRLSQKGVNPEYLDGLLIKTNSVLSGSFILQCLLNVSWDNSDVDIFSKIRQSKILTKREQIQPEPIQNNIKAPIHKFEAYFWQLYNQHVGSEKEKLFFPYGQGNPESPYTAIIGYGYSRKYEFENNGDKVILNFIGTRRNSKKIVRKCFDLSIVRNYYDGKKVRLENIMHILTRRARLMPFSDMGKMVNGKLDPSVKKRLEKYKERGFRIKHHRTYDALYEISRFYKYNLEISRNLPRDTRFHYKMPEKMHTEYLDRFRLESNSIQRIKMETSDHRYVVLRFNRYGSHPLEILVAVQNRDDKKKRNLLTYAVCGTKTIVKQIRIREKLNPPVKVKFNYKKEMQVDSEYLPSTKLSLEDIAAIVDRDEF